MSQNRCEAACPQPEDYAAASARHCAQTCSARRRAGTVRRMRRPSLTHAVSNRANAGTPGHGRTLWEERDRAAHAQSAHDCAQDPPTLVRCGRGRAAPGAFLRRQPGPCRRRIGRLPWPHHLLVAHHLASTASHSAARARAAAASCLRVVRHAAPWRLSVPMNSPMPPRSALSDCGELCQSRPRRARCAYHAHHACHARPARCARRVRPPYSHLAQTPAASRVGYRRSDPPCCHILVPPRRHCACVRVRALRGLPRTDLTPPALARPLTFVDPR